MAGNGSCYDYPGQKIETITRTCVISRACTRLCLVCVAVSIFMARVVVCSCVTAERFRAVTQLHTTTLDKKKEPSSRFAARRTLFPRVISCSIRRDQRRAKVADSRGSDLPCA